MTKKIVNILKKETAYNGFLSITRVTLEHSLFAGGMSGPVVREVLERGHSVAVLIRDPVADEVVLVEQFRIGAVESENPWLTELVAGVIEPGEQPEDVARREALEESGAEVSTLEFITHYYCSVGGSTETTIIFYAEIDAENVGGIHGVATENEDIRVIKMPTPEFINMLEDSRIHTASLMIAGLWLKNKLRQ